MRPLLRPDEVSTYFGRRLVELMDIPKGAAVLDVGTGRGASLVPAAGRVGPNGNVIGIDVSENVINLTSERIKELGLTNARALVMNGLCMSFDNGIFDFVLGGFVITDLYEQDQGLTDINRVLKDEGRVGFYSWAFAEDAELMARLLREHGGLDVQGADSIIFDQETRDSMERMLYDAEFENVRTLTEHVDLVFTDEEEWWREMWDIGWRHHVKEIETKGENQLERFKEYCFEALQDYGKGDGLSFVESVVFGFGTKRIADDK